MSAIAAALTTSAGSRASTSSSIATHSANGTLVAVRGALRLTPTVEKRGASTRTKLEPR
jgi:hypothetical protein